jgi:hypothetical protein
VNAVEALQRLAGLGRTADHRVAQRQRRRTEAAASARSWRMPISLMTTT